MTILVGGQGRKAGKTLVMCQIIAATPEIAWFAVKLSPHAHEPVKDIGATDTGRFLAAGAIQAILARSIAEVPEAADLIIESNSALPHLMPDLIVFVSDPCRGDYKASAWAVQERADLVVNRELTEVEILDLVAMIHQRRGKPGVVSTPNRNVL